MDGGESMQRQQRDAEQGDGGAEEEEDLMAASEQIGRAHV